ncbi:methionine aminopeptidase 1A-like [Vicia villosa]|uniref:methionine aminopeptidase 1A-like n=1 Tax=Vicia villosa TaxID=3911 RepID=UPI00273CCD0A|nr:methionine aminopeptidase 1A-like [Vicia villosa]
MELKLPPEGSAFCSQECFKSSWSSHKSVRLKAKLSSGGTQNSNSLGEGWLYCVKRGQGQTPKLPYYDWTGKATHLVTIAIFSWFCSLKLMKTSFISWLMLQLQS